MIVSSHAESQCDQKRAQRDLRLFRTPESECCISHQTSGVDHTKLVDELHRVFEGCVEEKTACADNPIAYECDQKYTVVSVNETIADPQISVAEKEEVCEGIDNFGSIVREIIVLVQAERSSQRCY